MNRNAEVLEVRAVAEKSAGVSAFFDLDGTLLPLPSLEQRFFRILRYRREVRLENYFLWLSAAVGLFPRGIGRVMHSNKMYLSGTKSLDDSDAEDYGDSSAHTGGHQAEGQASAPPRRNPRCPVPHFFDNAVDRIAWHASCGHTIALVSGTLEQLAKAAARELEAALAVRGFATRIHACATRLEERHGKWTGRIVGEAMFGEAKARAIAKLAKEMHIDLTQSFAYGDSAWDEAMLAAVGKPAAVNPSGKFLRIAQARNWPVLRWTQEKGLTQRTQSSQGTQRRETDNVNNFLCTTPRSEGTDGFSINGARTMGWAPRSMR